MADTVTVDNGSLADYIVASDEVNINGAGAAHVAYAKLADGTNGSTQVIQGGEQGLFVMPRYDLQRIAVTSGGLTTATTAYTSGDQVGTQFTFANAGRVTGGSGRIVAATLISAADIIGAYDLVITRSSITLAADNAAYAISDTDALTVIDVIQLSGAIDLGNNRIARASGLSIPYNCDGGTSLYGSLITRAGHTFFGAVTDLQVTLWVERN